MRATLTRKRRALLSYIRLPEEAEQAIKTVVAKMKAANETFYEANPDSERIPEARYEEIILRFRLVTLEGRGLL